MNTMRVWKCDLFQNLLENSCIKMSKDKKIIITIKYNIFNKK